MTASPTAIAIEGVDVMVIYGPEYDMWLEGIDPELQAAMARAYNRWGQEMRETSGGMVITIGPVPLNDVAACGRRDPVRARAPRHPVLLGPARPVQPPQPRRPLLRPGLRAAPGPRLRVRDARVHGAQRGRPRVPSASTRSPSGTRSSTRTRRRTRSLSMIVHGVYERFPRLRRRVHGGRLRLAARAGCTGSTSTSSSPARWKHPSSRCRPPTTSGATAGSRPSATTASSPTSSAGWATTTSCTRPTSPTPTRSTRTPPTTSSRSTTTSCGDESKRKVLWDNALDLYRFPEGYLPRADERHPATVGGGRLRRARRRVPAGARVLRDRVARRRPEEIERTQLRRLRAARARRGEGAVLRRAAGRDAGFDPASTSHRSTTSGARPCTPSTTSARASTRTRRGATTRASRPRDALARADAGVHVGRHHREVAADLLHAVGPRGGRRCSPPARSTCRASGPATSSSTRGRTAPHNGAFVVRRGAAPLAQLRRAHHRHRATSRAANARSSWRSSTARRRSSRPATTCCASPTSRGRWATTRRPTSSSPRSPTSATATLLESTFGVECFNSYGFHEVQWVSVECPRARRAAHLRGRVRRADRRPRDRRAAARRRARVDLHHRALQDREPAVPVQHHGPLVPVPARAVRVRELAAQDGAVRRPRRQHGEAARRQRVARGRRRGRARGRRRRSPTGSCAPCARTTATSSSCRSPSDGDPSTFGRLAAAIETRLKDRLGVRHPRRGGRAGRARRVDRSRHVPQAEAVP